MPRPRRLLSVGHSYVVALNRRLAHELTEVGKGTWEVTAAAPRYFHGNDLRPVAFEPLLAEPCRVIEVPAYCTRHVHFFFYGRQLRSLLAQPWNLVHCWEEPYILAGGQVAWWTRRDVPLIFWTAQNISKRYPPPFNWIERFCLRRAVAWLACGQSTVDALSGRGYGQLPHRIAPLGVDLKEFCPSLESGLAVHKSLGWGGDGPPVIGFLGRFTEEKGLPLLQRVLDGLTAPWRALFVGTGPLAPALENWSRRHGDRVRICTEVRHAEVPRYLNAMDVLCAPSQTTPRWREQFGRMLIEAFACGVPVIGSDSGEIPHVIGDAGMVVGEQDEEGWRRTLAEFLENPASRHELAACGLERVREHFAWPIIARKYLDFFEQFINESR